MDPPTGAVVKPPFYSTLYFRVLISIALGVLLGVYAPEAAVKMRPSAMRSSSSSR